MYNNNFINKYTTFYQSKIDLKSDLNTKFIESFKIYIEENYNENIKFLELINIFNKYENFKI